LDPALGSPLSISVPHEPHRQILAGRTSHEAAGRRPHPYLAGRSPTYIAREPILFREGKRANSDDAPMV
jgi:hypothetical protein